MLELTIHIQEVFRTTSRPPLLPQPESGNEAAESEGGVVVDELIAQHADLVGEVGFYSEVTEAEKDAWEVEGALGPGVPVGTVCGCAP